VEIKRLSLKVNMTWTLVGSVFYSFTQWLLLIILAKLGTLEMVGQYALGLAITAPIVLFTEMNLRLAQVTDAKGTFLFSHYLGTRLISVGVSIIFFLSVVLFVGFAMYTATVILLIGIAKLPESISGIFHGQLQKHERMDYITKSQILKGMMTVIIFSTTLYFTESLILSIIGQIIVWTVVLLIYDLRVVKKYEAVKVSFQMATIKRLVKMTLPLGIVALLSSVNTNIPTYLVEYFLGREELGYFAAILYILFAGDRMVNSIGQPAIPRLATFFEQKNIRSFQKLLIRLVAFGFVIGVLGFIVAYLIGDTVLSIIYTPSYATYADLFIFIMVSGIFYYPATFLELGFSATRYFKLQPLLATFWVLVSIIGCVLLIPKFGAVGAAIALIIFSFSQVISMLVVLYLILRKSYV
jgi:O-antigen/teichoic acid export membrane protein